MDTILELQHVSKRFSGLVAVNDLSIKAERGSIHSLVGPNGSGKSTTISMINGMLPLTEGDIFLNEEKISGLSTHEIARCGIGRTFQNIKVFGTMTVLENVMVGGHALNKKSGSLIKYLVNVKGTNREERIIRERAESILEFIGMKDLMHQQVRNLAYGRQKMTELGRALVSNPQLLLLDEPAAGLNPSERVELTDMLVKVQKTGVSLFLVEHNMDIVMKISDRITVINFGAKIAEGTPDEVRNDDEVIRAYLGSKYQKNAETGD